MNRREYVGLYFSGLITALLSACKHSPVDNPIPAPRKRLLLTGIVPDYAIAGETMEVRWLAENIKSISVLTKTGTADWVMIASNLDPESGMYRILLPEEFATGELFSIKLTGGGLEALKESIYTLNVPVSKKIEILKVEPADAIAGEKLDVFYKAENISLVLLELRNKKGDLMNIKTLPSGSGNYQLFMPSSFIPGELLSIRIIGDGHNAVKENIQTFNVFNINTDDYPELKIADGIQKIIPASDEIWLKRISGKIMKAFSGSCTHAGCGIDYIKNDQVFFCSCHGSRFSSDGMVLNGPASIPLNEYKCEFVDNELFRVLY